MIRWLSIGVIVYMIIGITWWGLLLNRKNHELFSIKITNTSDEQIIEQLKQEQSRQNLMIIGEGLFLGLSLLMGIYIINRSATREIRNANAQNDFLLSVSHELKSPIASIKLVLQTLTRKELTKDRRLSILESGISETNRLESLVQNILLSANIDNHPLQLYKEPTNISDLLNGLIDQIKKENKDFEFIVNHREKNIIAPVDKLNIRQALKNIVDNGIKYSGNHKIIRIDSYMNSNLIFIEISNKGEVIGKEEASLIFNKFYRSKNRHSRTIEGTGIGLYITKEIVKAHNGTIRLISEDGLNKFIISLPKYE